MEKNPNATVGSFVAEDFRTAKVFQKYGIDFCCRGGKTIKEVCNNKSIEQDKLLSELQEAAGEEGNKAEDFDSWNPGTLADYIVEKHHTYVANSIPPLTQFLDKLCKVHGSNHPELFEIRDEFYASAENLSSHMKKEEIVLFPYIKRLVEQTGESDAEQKYAGNVAGPVSMMMMEHEIEGDRFERITELTNSFIPPDDACTTYRVAFSMLEEFRNDLHLHIHLENNILFPKALKLESQTA